jgi:hypothetical protein
VRLTFEQLPVYEQRVDDGSTAVVIALSGQLDLDSAVDDRGVHASHGLKGGAAGGGGGDEVPPLNT